jgi:predicted NBD/HSP70 family sugar kinase
MLKSYLLGIDLGGTQLRFILAEEKTGITVINKQSSKKSYPSPFCENEELKKDSYIYNLPDKEKVNAYIVKKLPAYLKELNIQKEQISGIGISVAGKVHSDCSFIGANMPKKFAKKIGNKYGVDLISDLKQIFDVRIEIENDANCAGIAQSIYYAEQGIDPNSTFYITVSTGIGGGGPKRDLDEVGHMIVDGYFPGLKPLCGCGTYGCIEAFASGEGIKKQALTILNIYFNKSELFNKLNIYENIRTDKKYNLQEIIRKSELKNLYQDKKDINAKTIFNLANLNKKRKTPDDFAYYLVDTAAARFAKVLINISSVHSIERFGVGGSVVTNNPKYLDLVQKKINLYNSGCILDMKIKVELTPLGDYTTDYGALFLVVEPKYQQQWIKTIMKLNRG